MVMKLSSPKTLRNALAAEKTLVLDELEAELVRTQHIQDVLCGETGSLIRSSQGASFPYHSSTPRVSQ